MDEASVRVATRVRPLTAKEQMAGCTECIGFIPGSADIVLDSTRVFTFDFVYDPVTSQRHVFQTAVLPLIDRFLEGFNATCLAYGQVRLSVLCVYIKRIVLSVLYVYIMFLCLLY